MAIKRLLSIVSVMMLLSVFVGCDDGYEVDSTFFQNTFVTSSKESATSSETNSSSTVSSRYESSENESLSSKQSTSSKLNESQEITSSEVQSSEVSIIQEIEPTSQTVYITPTGKRWHLEQSCAGKNATATTLEKAEEKSLTPCKKCAS